MCRCFGGGISSITVQSVTCLKRGQETLQREVEEGYGTGKEEVGVETPEVHRRPDETSDI